jgi:hypothetical protein
LPIYPDVTPFFRVAGSLFFAGMAIIFFGLGVLMVYEVTAIYTRQVPTISLITAFEFLKHPVWWVVAFGVVMFALGALVTHFTHWTP